jgi:hypothetical protein
VYPGWFGFFVFKLNERFYIGPLRGQNNLPIAVIPRFFDSLFQRGNPGIKANASLLQIFSVLSVYDVNV